MPSRLATFLVKQEIEGTPNAVLVARYCKLFGLEPSLQLDIASHETTMRMAINWACYLAYVQSENEEYTKAQDKGQHEAVAMGKFLEDLKEQSVSRGN